MFISSILFVMYRFMLFIVNLYSVHSTGVVPAIGQNLDWKIVHIFGHVHLPHFVATPAVDFGVHILILNLKGYNSIPR